MTSHMRGRRNQRGPINRDRGRSFQRNPRPFLSNRKPIQPLGSPHPVEEKPKNLENNQSLEEENKKTLSTAENKEPEPSSGMGGKFEASTYNSSHETMR